MNIEDLIFLILIWIGNWDISGTINCWIGFLIFGTITGTLILIGYIIKNKEAKFLLNMMASVFLLVPNIFAFSLVARNYIFNIYIALILFFLSNGFIIYTIIQGKKVYKELILEGKIFPSRSQIQKLSRSDVSNLELASRIYERKGSSNPKIYEKVRLGDEFEIPSKQLICSICDYKNPSDSRICRSCYSKFLTCLICNKPISKDEEIFCPYCSAPYHEREFLEWLKIKAHCKNCKKDLDLWEFQKYLEEREKDNELYSKLCIKCKKFIPIDANFCIYCGEKK